MSTDSNLEDPDAVGALPIAALFAITAVAIGIEIDAFLTGVAARTGALLSVAAPGGNSLPTGHASTPHVAPPSNRGSLMYGQT
jgi:hypothetical protein